MLHCHNSLESDHARFLRGFAPAGKRRRYPKASSMPSAACLPMLGIQCEYLSRVMVMLACPRRCWTSFGCTPRPRSNVAHVCLRLCQRIGGRSACLRSGLKWRLITASMGGGVAQGPGDDSRGGRILRPGGGGRGRRLMPFFELANSGENVHLIPL
jgi:hypothetical protein